MTDVLALIDPGARLARPDLAELRLEGLVRADRYAQTSARHGAGPAVSIWNGSGADARRIDELLAGEVFDVLDEAKGRAWGRARRSGVVGWVDLGALRPGASSPTHRVRALTAPVHPASAGETAQGAPLFMNALVRVEEAVGDRARLAGLGWVAVEALAPIGVFEPDLAAVAEAFVGAPHSLGGRTAAGTDCSGLVQQALMACGLAAPRWASEQAQLGRAVETPARGDLVVWLKSDLDPWGGHSGVMIDADRVIHASGRAGEVLIQPLAEVAAAYVADGFEPAIFRRLSI
ncbi:MAG: C40 family peptidase [Brevundimonas sp.]|uniref:C40 family peptidase n=1 Tax=Brevundimonas sp. TaxID=1871086 RepID=UPI00391A11CB